MRPSVFTELRELIHSFGDGIVERAAGKSATFILINLCAIVLDEFVIILELPENHDT